MFINEWTDADSGFSVDNIVVDGSIWDGENVEIQFYQKASQMKLFQIEMWLYWKQKLTRNTEC